MNDEGLADVEAASPFRLPGLHPGIGSAAWVQYSAARQFLKRLLFFRELRPVSVEIAGALDPPDLAIGMGAVREIADAGSGRVEPLEVVLECDRRAVPCVGVGHPAAGVRLHECLDLFERVGVEEQ